MSETIAGTNKTLLQEYVKRIGQREYANQMQLGGGVTTEMLEPLIERLAQRLYEDVRARGMRPVADSAKTYAATPHPADPLGSVAQIAMKIRAELSDDPRDLLAMAVYVMEEHRQEAIRMREWKEQWMAKCAKMFELVAAANDLDDLRQALRDYDEDWF